MKPTPSTAPTSVCVVEIGRPVPDAITTVAAAPSSAAKPRLGVSSVIFLPTVVMAGLVLELFSTDGLVNRIIGAVGIEGVRFFNEPGWFRPLYIGSGIWQQVGWSSIIYLAALSGVNPELYESAWMDGAGRLRRAWHVSLPGIAPTIYLLFILAVGQLMSVGFEKPFLLQNPAIYETADVIETYVYRRGIINQEYGYSAAVGLFNSAINLALLLVANRLTGRYTQHSLW